MTSFSNRTLPFPTRVIADALPDVLAARAGLYQPTDPVALEILDRNVSMIDIGAHFVGATRDEPPASIANRMMGSADWGEAQTTALGRVMYASFDATVSGYTDILRTIQVPDFKPQRVPTLHAADFLDQPEFSEWPYVAPVAGQVLDSDEAVQTKGALLVFSRQALLSDSGGQIAMQASAIGNQAALAVAAAVAASLSGTDNLDDAALLFNAAAGNYVSTGGPPTITTLAEGLAKLWRQPTPALSIAGVAAAFIVVPPELQAIAAAAVLALYGDMNSARGHLDIVTLPHLASTTEWYLLGRPLTSPVLGMLTLQGDSPLMLERVKTPMGIDGMAMRARLDFRIVRLSRIGGLKNHGM
jgi:hypothetical protein